MSFRLLKKHGLSQARRGVLSTSRGDIETPFFMPIATKGSVKSLTSEDLIEQQAQIILSNTYHLYLRPGMEVIKGAGGLHSFMSWDGPILTDSGGYQVFSLGHRLARDENFGGTKDMRPAEITDEGVRFWSHLDGTEHMLTPEHSVEIQETLGSDIMMVLDECVAYPSGHDQAEEALERTTAWAERCLRAKKKKEQLLFGIVQGSTHKDLRLRSSKELIQLNFDGYAIGGLAVGEKREEMFQALDWVGPGLPEDKPRYLMGVGFPEEIIEAVKRGIDMFDCVIPTRHARHGALFSDLNTSYLQKVLSSSDKIDLGKLYTEVRIKNEKYQKDFSPINESHPLLRKYTKAYLRHLFMAGEPLGIRLATLNNIYFYLQLMRSIREDIK